MKAAALLVILVFPASLVAQRADFGSRDFGKADSVAALYPGYSLLNLKDLAGKLTESLSFEEEKFRAIYSWVCQNIAFDHGLYLANKRNRKKLGNSPEDLEAWNKEGTIRMFDKLLNNQKTVCTGYAFLLKELTAHAGLSCVIIDGYGRTPKSNVRGLGLANHTWNAIRLNNKWYLCDATWSSGAIDQNGNFIRKYDNSYFLSDPRLFVRNHFPLDSSWILIRDKPTLHEFLNGPIVYTGLFQHHISQVHPATLDIDATRGEAVSFSFGRDKKTAICKMALLMDGHNGSETIAKPILQDSIGLYRIDHVFRSKGTHVVHVLFDTQYALTYSVRVR